MKKPVCHDSYNKLKIDKNLQNLLQLQAKLKFMCSKDMGIYKTFLKLLIIKIDNAWVVLLDFWLF